MYLKLIITTGLVSAMAIGTSLADESDKKRGKNRMGNIIEQLDKDQSGAISQEEFTGFGLGRVTAADANEDGELSADELVAQMMAERMLRRANAVIKRLDRDGDGKLTVAEIEDTQAKQFALLDGNNDGALTEDELRKMRGSKNRSKRKGYKR